MKSTAELIRALIPCGGKGTRMLALTGGRPKELIEVGGVPLVVRVARECAASGIGDLMVVTAPGKEAILECLAPLAGRTGFPARIVFAEQREPRGLADAIRLGRDFAGEGPIAVALPDNLFGGAVPALRQVMDVARGTGRSAVAMVGIAADEASRRGATAVYSGVAAGREFRIAHIPDKGAKSSTFSTGGSAMAYTGVGRYAFGADLWATIDEVERSLPQGVELDDIPVMQTLLARDRLTGCLIEGRFLDVGIPAGLAEANELLGAELE
jgi:UTP--glucose-1-phosphate uridylyltransferase